MDDQKEDPPVLEVVQEFKSFAEFEEALQRYQKHNYCLFLRRRSNLCKDNSELKYTNARYECKHFGSKRDNPNLTGERPMQKSYKIGCKAFLYLSLKPKLQRLVVDRFQPEHNHPCSKVTYEGYPEVRRMSRDTIKSVQEFTKLKAKPILIKPLVKAREGDKIILSRDISNVRTKQIRDERQGRSEEEMLLAALN
ncbi:hypothetical protein KUF71_000979 [Frankliniella fusca]|uniref:ZSWIM3 N-terminal domain-containing protein n=1 Tax=Frankliniella fusca TaxID=407009 RepID=A0AAE1HBM2_9NEOP|nr:hypothetical protein KUF71_000979 [Frankliniella fusca]